jgi:hypothetical protein
MKRVIIIVAVALVGAAPPSPPVFEYKGFRAGGVTAPEQLATCKAEAEKSRALLAPVYKRIGSEPDDANLLTCSTDDALVAGTRVQSEKIVFFEDRLTRMSIVTDSLSFPTLQKAFEAKYGRPCQMGVRHIQTLSEASLESPYYTWCFATGKLTAVLMGPNIDQMSAEYIDDWQQPEKNPEIDF